MDTGVLPQHYTITEYNLNHKTVQRLMKELGTGLPCQSQKISFLQREVGKIAPNLLNRNFHAERPNQRWVTDVTEFSLFGQEALSFSRSGFAQRIFGELCISERPGF